VPEPESDIERHATASKRKASETEFEIPSAKRTGPVAGGSVTESDSDSNDVLLPSRGAPAVVSNLSNGTVPSRHVYDRSLCSSGLVA
jgi:hypothetical protein